MAVPLLDLKPQYLALKDELDRAVLEVAASTCYIGGPKIGEFEKQAATYCGTKYAVGVTSGTDALLLALMVSCIGPGDEVVTTPYTFFATGGSIWRTGAKIVFADIEPDTFNLDPEKVADAVTDKTRAIMPVHLYGQCAAMDPIMEIARKRNIVVIEDAAQAIGSEYKGRRAGSIGDFGCFSFFPSKNLGAFGDGGLVTTNDPEKYKLLVMFRNHGSEPKYYHKYVGGNFRLDPLQAAVLSVKLPHLDAWTAKRQANAALYAQLIEKAGLLKKGVRLPKVVQSRHIFNQFVLRVPKRDELRKFLGAKEIGCEIYYPVPLHMQECFAALGYKKGAFPESEKAAGETIAVPIHPDLPDGAIGEVVGAIAEFYG